MATRRAMGKCEFCHGSFGASHMTRHIQSCGKAPTGPKAITCFHLVAKGRWASAYWLHLALPADALLSDLDSFLRRIWLECCGHMSAFEIEGKRYSCSPLDSEELDLDVPLKRALKIGTTFSYEYDFGSTTELRLKVVGMRTFELQRGKRLLLLARNEPPEVRCDQCGEAAAERICTECQWSGKGWLCERCARKHRCGTDYLLPVVNSPRAGVCGYTG